MKKCLLILLGVLWGSLSFLFAENVPVDKALQVATRFTQQIGDKPLRSGQSLELAYAARPSLRAAAPEAYYYVFNRGSNNGYIIVAGDDRAYPILGYGTTGDFSYEKIPDNMKWWLQEYADQIQYAYTNVTEPEAAVKNRWEVLQNGTGLPSLKSQVLLNTALWEQNSPFNDQCPMVNGRRAVTGCVATAMAIIMKYHKYPDQGTGSHSYTDNYKHNYSASFSTAYAWNQMLDDYSGNYTVAQGDAVAKLMYHCGVSCEMNYDPNGSGTALGKIAIALPQYFKYDAGICGMIRDGHSDSEWASLIQTELNNNRPIAYGGTTSGNAGHAFVFAGYNTSNQYYVNWGWGKKYDGSDYNGWFRLSALTLAGSAYNYQQDMVIGIQRPAGGSPVHRFVIAKYETSSKGLTLATTPIQKDNFTVNVSTVVIEGSGAFKAIASIAHINAKGGVKGIVSSAQYSLDARTPGGYYGNLAFENCKITQPIEAGDQLCMVYKINNTGDYQIVEGSPDLPIRINLTGDTPSGSYKVTWNTLSGVTVSAVSGYDANSIAAGGTFKFKITNTTGKSVVVKNGTTPLTPDASGVYTISNIQKDIQLTLSLVALTYKVTWNTLSGVTVSAVSGYNANSIAAGGTFKFKITAPAGKAVVVKNGTTTLTPDYSGVYTISNVQANITLTLSLVALAEYTVTIPSTVTGVVIKKPTGFTGKVKSGDNFKFSVDPLDGYAAGVKVDGKYLYREYHGAWEGDYTIYDITRNVVIEIEAIRLSQVNTTKTVATTVGNLENYITDRECCYLQELIVKGTMNVMDMIFMRSDLPEITTLNLSEATLSGNALTMFDLCFMSRLKEIILPASIISIQEKAFCYDVSLSRVVMNRSVPPALHTDAFLAIPASQLTIVVPPGAGPAYRAAAVWKNYTIVEMAATTYRVTFPVLTGFEIKASAGYNALSVPEGSDFKFTVTPKAGYEAYTVKVMANNVVLTPASGNVYTIRNVTANQTVKVEVTPPDTPTTYRILSRADRGATLVPESGYDANVVAAGDDFKFHVSVNAAYHEWELKVEVDGLTLRPDSRGVYTISNIRADKNVVITLTEIYTVTFVKPKEDVKMVAESGYDAERIVAGYDFKFHLVSRYTEDQLTVSANGVVLRPIGKIYTIYGIRENQQVNVFVNDVANEKISASNVRIQVIGNKLCITHPTMKNVPVYVVSFDGTLSKADKLNGVYTELELPGKGAYIVSFEGFSRKIMVR